MKKLRTIIFILLLAISCSAADLASSFKQAAALGDAQEKDRGTQAYLHLDLMPYYQQNYGPVFQSCLASTQHADTSPFSFVVAIGKDGHVLRLYVDHDTNIFACVRKTLLKDEFPRPPSSPYYMHISMNFSD